MLSAQRLWLIAAITFNLLVLLLLITTLWYAFDFRQQLAALQEQHAQDTQSIQSLTERTQTVMQSLDEIKATQLKNQQSIASFTQAQSPDKLQRWEQIRQLSHAIEPLPFRIIARTSTAPEATPSTDNHVLWSTWQELKGLVRVTRQDLSSIPATLTVLEKAQVLQITQLMCEQIQWALLTNNDTVYRTTLSALEKTLIQYFEATPAQAAVLSDIRALAQKSLSQGAL